MILILNSLIASMVIMGAHILIDFLLSDWFKIENTDVYDKYSGRWQLKILKPLFLCPTCMTSVWGIPLFFLMFEFDIVTFFSFISIVALLNYLISKRLL